LIDNLLRFTKPAKLFPQSVKVFIDPMLSQSAVAKLTAAGAPCARSSGGDLRGERNVHSHFPEHLKVSHSKERFLMVSQQ
jgi:hypothetical protein